MPPSFAFKRWLLLCLVVLLAHLGLLQLMPLSLAPSPPLAQVSLVFDTRPIHMLSPLAAAKSTPAPSLGPKKPTRRTAQPKPTRNQATIASSTPVAPDKPVAGAQAVQNIEPPAAAQEPASAAQPAAVDVAMAQEPVMPVSAPAPAQDKPYDFDASKLSESTRLTYTLKTSKFPFSFHAELLWRNLGTTYSTRLRYSVFGLERMQTSRGQVTPLGLAPERFSDKYKSEVAAHFNYAQRKVTFSANTPDATLQPGAQDRLSVLMQLGALLATDPKRFAIGTTLAIQTVGPRAADVWLFTVGHSESLDLPGGTVEGLKLERNPRDLYDQKVEVWLAPQLGYLPARIRITETNGDSADQQWASTEAAGDID